MPDVRPVLLLSLLLLPISCAEAALLAGSAAIADSGLAQALTRQAPTLNRRVLDLGLAALRCASRHDATPPRRLGVIDYSLPSTEPRMWIFDLATRRLLHAEWVAHGKASGDNYTRSFSNAPGSLQTSLGLFRTSETYHGSNGYSLRLNGLDPGFNDRARERAIVLHGAPYVSEALARKLGRLGRSWGCPAVRNSVAKPLIDDLKDGQYVFAYFPDETWLRDSSLLACATGAAPVAAATLRRGGATRARQG
jgi:hypothetical protein